MFDTKIKCGLSVRVPVFNTMVWILGGDGEELLIGEIATAAAHAG
jgi:hypothetical protein